METPLRKARKSRGLTLTQVARENDMDEGNLSRIERGEQVPGVDVAARLAAFFKPELSELEILYPERYEKRSRRAMGV